MNAPPRIGRRAAFRAFAGSDHQPVHAITRGLVLAMATMWLAAVCGITALTAQQPPTIACPRCGWMPPETRTIRRVRSVGDLYGAVADAKPNTTVLLADGEYVLDRSLDFAAPGVVLRSASGNRSKVVLRGEGMDNSQAGVALSVSAPDITIADVTVGFVRHHAIQVRGERGASRVMIHNVRALDAGQQLFKGSTDGGAMHADDGTVACSVFEYTDHAPSSYTNGVDVLAGNGWTVRDNVFRRIRGPESMRWSAGPAILFWAHSQNTRVERNTILDSFRGIAFGLGPGASSLARDGEKRVDHQGGWIRQNVIVNLNAWADEGIEANAARDVAIDHNTVITMGLPWSISLRFPSTSGHTRNNLTSRPVILRDSGTTLQAANIAGASPDWFVDLPSGDARLKDASLGAVNTGVRVDEITADMLGAPRVRGTAPDAGAHEFPGATR